MRRSVLLKFEGDYGVTQERRLNHDGFLRSALHLIYLFKREDGHLLRYFPG